MSLYYINSIFSIILIISGIILYSKYGKANGTYINKYGSKRKSKILSNKGLTVGAITLGIIFFLYIIVLIGYYRYNK